MNDVVMTEQDLSLSRREMTDNLALFFTHVKYTMTLLLTFFTAALAILGFGIKEFGEEEKYVSWLILAASLILIMTFMVGRYSENLVRRYYKLYVASYVYAARVHDKHSNESHPWLAEIIACVDDVHDDKSVKEFMSEGSDDSHSWHYYQKMISSISWLSFIVGSLMLRKR